MTRIPRSIITAGLILVAFVAYFAFGTFIRGGNSSSGDAGTATTAPSETKPTVIVEPVSLVEHTVFRSFKGRTEANRSVTVRSETSGQVTDARIEDGTFVRKGELLCGLAVESRAARIAEAKAAVEAARLEYESAASLQEKGWTTSNRAATLKASLDQAEAALTSAKIELERTRIKAPFAGVFERRTAEIGDFLTPGAACGNIVDLDPLLVVFEATEDTIGQLEAGMTAQVILATGEEVSGGISYIARTANTGTRTFRIEVSLPNPDSRIAAGLTAEAKVALGRAPAVQLSPATLVLHDDGRVGVRYVDDGNAVQFAEVSVIDDVDDGIWVTGLPQNAKLLREGQDYVREGTIVDAVSAEAS